MVIATSTSTRSIDGIVNITIKITIFNAPRNGTLKMHLLKELTLFFFSNRTLKAIYFRYFIVLTY